MNGEIVRRYDGRTEHADWCKDQPHEGFCLDWLTGWEPAPEQVRDPSGRGSHHLDRERDEAELNGSMDRGEGMP